MERVYLDFYLDPRALEPPSSLGFRSRRDCWIVGLSMLFDVWRWLEEALCLFSTGFALGVVATAPARCLVLAGFTRWTAEGAGDQPAAPSRSASPSRRQRRARAERSGLGPREPRPQGWRCSRRVLGGDGSGVVSGGSCHIQPPWWSRLILGSGGAAEASRARATPAGRRRRPSRTPGVRSVAIGGGRSVSGCRDTR